MIQKTDKYFYLIGIGLILTPFFIGIPIFILGFLGLFFDSNNQIKF